jgi:PAS domain S-box-containing protein
MDYQKLVGAFAQAAGVEKAREVVDSAAVSIGLDDADTFDGEEIVDICEIIQRRESGYLSMVANEVRVSLQAERRFETLLANVPEPAVVAAFDADEPVVSMANVAFEETFGYDAAAVEGQRLASLITPGDAALSSAALWARSGNASGTEIERETADGKRRTFLFQSSIVRRESGETEGYGIYTDITDRKRREQTLQHQNEQLERFVDVISHDLRNPLEVSSGRIELALDVTEDEAVSDHLEAARDANERMGALVEDLLSLAKQGQVVGETEQVSLAAAARSAWSHVETGAGTLDVRDDQQFEADPGRLSALFENLFRNSVEHGSTNPDAVTVTVGTTDAGFYVADDGPGIDPEHRDAIFTEGFTTSDGGTGFGLSIVETIADAHGWSLSCTDSETGGARFEISL